MGRWLVFEIARTGAFAAVFALLASVGAGSAATLAAYAGGASAARGFALARWLAVFGGGVTLVACAAAVGGHWIDGRVADDVLVAVEALILAGAVAFAAVMRSLLARAAAGS